MILDRIFPPALHFVGPDSLLRSLHTAAQTGLPIRVRGRLYVADRMFLVTAVEAADTPT
jgi:hypothetical protein